MIDQIPVSLLSSVSSNATSALAVPFAADVDKFNAAMSTPTASTQEAVVVQGSIPSQVSQVGSKPSLGDSIISGLQSASQDMQSKWAYVSETLSGSDLGVTDALRLQMSVMQASVQYELISKGISKTVQNLDQTLKTQ